MTGWLFAFGPQDYNNSHVDIMAEDYPQRSHRKFRRCALYSAAEHGKTRHVSVLLMLGKDPDRADTYGITPLQIAAWNNHCKVVQKLCKHSSDVNIADKVGHSALFKAVFKNCVTCVRCLLSAGSVVDTRDYSRSTPLLLACELGFQDILKVLLEAGSRTSLQNRRGDAALHVAAAHQHVTCVRLLLDAGADPDQRNGSTGSTALMSAAVLRPSVSAFKIIELLLNENCTIGLKSKNTHTKGHKLTALELAYCAKNTKTVALLYRAGGDISRVQRWTAMQMDIFSGCDDVMEALHDLVVTPRTLKDICRIQIRHHIRGICAASDLPLPNSLIHFIDLRDVFDNEI